MPQLLVAIRIGCQSFQKYLSFLYFREIQTLAPEAEFLANKSHLAINFSKHVLFHSVLVSLFIIHSAIHFDVICPPFPSKWHKGCWGDGHWCDKSV